MLDLNDLALPFRWAHDWRPRWGSGPSRGESVTALLFGQVGKLNSWRIAQDGHRTVSGILRVGWPHPEIGGRDDPKQVAAPNRFDWPRSAEIAKWSRPKYATAVAVQQNPSAWILGAEPG